MIFHSGSGSAYTAYAFTGLCERLGIVQSMGRTGSALPQGIPSLSDKLKFLFMTVRRPDKRAHREEVAMFIADRTGLKADLGYISALVTGVRDNRPRGPGGAC